MVDGRRMPPALQIERELSFRKYLLHNPRLAITAHALPSPLRQPFFFCGGLNSMLLATCSLDRQRALWLLERPYIGKQL